MPRTYTENVVAMTVGLMRDRFIDEAAELIAKFILDDQIALAEALLAASEQSARAFNSVCTELNLRVGKGQNTISRRELRKIFIDHQLQPWEAIVRG